VSPEHPDPRPAGLSGVAQASGEAAPRGRSGPPGDPGGAAEAQACAELRRLKEELLCHGSSPAARTRGPRQCGPLPFLIQRDGTWLYRGSPIRRKPLVCLFASVLQRDETGTYWLETPAERGSIEVEDAPFVAVELDWRGCGRNQVLAFRTNVDQIVCAGPEHPLSVDWTRGVCGDAAGPAPYLRVRGEGPRAIRARVARAVYYELAALAVPGRCQGCDCLGVWSQNQFFPIGPLSPDIE